MKWCGRFSYAEKSVKNLERVLLNQVLTAIHLVNLIMYDGRYSHHWENAQVCQRQPENTVMNYTPTPQNHPKWFLI